MYSPAAVLSVVLLEAAAGGLAVLWSLPTWRVVRHGFEILLGVTLGLMALGAWAAMRGPLGAVSAPEAQAAALWAGRGLAVTTLLALASPLLIAARAPEPGRVTGLLATLIGAATFLPFSQLRVLLTPAPGGVLQGVAEMALGAFFLGAIWVGLVLGHWYLLERRLSNRYMVRVAWVNVAAVVAGLASVALSARNPVPCTGLSGPALARCLFAYSPLLSVGSLTIVLGVGLLGLVALIAAFNVRLAQEGGRSIQASTGMFYLAVILAPAAEFAAKVRFF